MKSDHITPDNQGNLIEVNRDSILKYGDTIRIHQVIAAGPDTPNEWVVTFIDLAMRTASAWIEKHPELRAHASEHIMSLVEESPIDKYDYAVAKKAKVVWRGLRYLNWLHRQAMERGLLVEFVNEVFDVVDALVIEYAHLEQIRQMANELGQKLYEVKTKKELADEYLPMKEEFSQRF